MTSSLTGDSDTMFRVSGLHALLHASSDADPLLLWLCNIRQISKHSVEQLVSCRFKEIPDTIVVLMRVREWKL